MPKIETRPTSATTAVGTKAAARLEAALARIDERLADLSDEERQELADRLVQEIKEGIRERIRRGEPV